MSERLPAGRALELGRALRDERVALRHERSAAHGAGHDHLAPLAERVRDLPAVDDRNRRGAVAVADPEAERVAAPDRAVDDLAGDLDRPPRLGPEGLRRRGGLGRAAEA